MRGLLRLLKGSYSLLLLTIGSSIVTGVFSTLIIKQIHASLSGTENFDVSRFAIVFFSMIGAYMIASLLASVSIAHINRNMIHRLRLVLSEKVLASSYELVENLKSNILPVLTDDLNHIANLVNRLPSVTTGLATVLGILIYLFWLSPLMGGLTLGVFLIVYVINYINLKFVGKYARLNRSQSNVIYKLIEGLVYGIANLMLHKRFQDRYVNKNIEEESEVQMKWYFKEMVFNSFNNRFNDVILMGFLGVIILLVYQYEIVTVSFFNTYLTLILFMLGPLSTVSGFFGTIKRIEASLIQIEKLGIKLNERNKEIYEQPSTENSIVDQQKKGSAPYLIKFDKIEFTYRNSDESFKLSDINLEIKKGARLFIEGGNGSGKSTLIKLMCGLYSPQKGSLLYKGIEISDSNLTEYRDMFAVVLTDSYLFNDLGHLSDDQLEKATFYLAMMEMDKKVSIIDKKFTTIELSEGQKKRLQLVYMLLEDKEVYIFDEWVAYQDAHSKELFYTKVLPHLKEQGKTVINIAHDYSYENLADQIIRMENGKMIDGKY
ncbi:MAG: cyclic peptide export ABC transporter [Balneola sp.]